MKPLRNQPFEASVPATEPVQRRGLAGAWTRLRRGLSRTVEAGRTGPERAAARTEACGGAGLIVLSLSGDVLHAGASAQRLLGRPQAELRAELQVYALDGCCRGALTGADGRALEVHAVQGVWSGGPAWVGMLSQVPQHARERLELELALAGAQQANAALQRLASVDPLTSLLNRRGLEAALTRETGRRRRSGEPLAALLIDCDDFKRINDSRGQSGGDRVLQQVGGRLLDSLRPSDHLGRIGGDEFLVLLPETGAVEALRVARRLRLAVAARPLREPGGAVELTVSLGLALLADEDDALEVVLARTGAALQRSKRRGKNRSSGAGADAPPEGDLLEQLRTGPGGEAALDVARVPLVRLGDETVCGWALEPLRAQAGCESRSELLRTALEQDSLVAVDLVCLEACAREARRWPGAERIHVALHPTTLREVPFERLAAALADRPGAPRFCLDISERELAGDPSALLERRRSLRAAGIQLAITDVGYGRSSLEHLIVLEPDLVKLEPGFALRSARGSDRTRSLRRMLRLVAALGCELWVDGIETRDDLAALCALGVPCGQGGLWGRHGALARAGAPALSGSGGQRNLRLVANAGPARPR